MTTPPSSERSGARTGERIAKLLARAGVASRREVERLIEAGRVKIGDEIVTTANTVLENLRGVTVDGKPVKAAEAARLFVFHKPSGLLTAERDPAGRPTIYTALRNALPQDAPRVMPVGRLDFNTEGLLLLTNDGELKRAMELPSSGIPRTYRARTFGDISQEQLEELIEGIEIDGFRYGKIDANMERRTGRNQWIEVTLTEGKNREVRRVLEHLGLEVSRLLRTSYGPFELLDLPRGAAVEVRPADVERFVKGLKGEPGGGDLKRISTWAKPAPSRPAPRPAAAPPPRGAPRRDTPRQEAPSYRGGKPYGGQPNREANRENWTPHTRDAEARPSPAPARGKRPASTTDSRSADRRKAPAASPAAGNPPRGKLGDRRPARPSDDRDRGEKLLDRPKTARAKPTGTAKPSGWAKAKPKARPGKPRKPGPKA